MIEEVVTHIPLQIERAMMILTSCIFCHCQIPASDSMAKYEEHLQVKGSWFS